MVSSGVGRQMLYECVTRLQYGWKLHLITSVELLQIFLVLECLTVYCIHLLTANPTPIFFIAHITDYNSTHPRPLTARLIYYLIVNMAELYKSNDSRKAGLRLTYTHPQTALRSNSLRKTSFTHLETAGKSSKGDEKSSKGEHKAVHRHVALRERQEVPKLLKTTHNKENQVRKDYVLREYYLPSKKIRTSSQEKLKSRPKNSSIRSHCFNITGDLNSPRECMPKKKSVAASTACSRNYEPCMPMRIEGVPTMCSLSTLLERSSVALELYRSRCDQLEKENKRYRRKYDQACKKLRVFDRRI